MRILLDIATILGGLAAIWFFWDRFSARFNSKKSAASQQSIGTSSYRTSSPRSPRVVFVAIVFAILGLLGAIPGGLYAVIFGKIFIDLSADLGLTIPMHIVALLVGAIGGVSVPLVVESLFDSLVRTFSFIDIGLADLIISGLFGIGATLTGALAFGDAHDPYAGLVRGSIATWVILGVVYLFRGGLRFAQEPA